MTTRTEKNKNIQKKIDYEKKVKYSKVIIKIFFLLIIIFFSIFLIIRYYSTSFIKTNEYIVKDSSLPLSFHGIKILHFSDLLYGSTIFTDDLNDLLDEFKRINPDIVIFTGDILDENYKLAKEEINDIINFFQNIPYNIGKYAVMGDLDNTTFDLIMEKSQFNVLENASQLIYYHDNTPIALLGFNSSTNNVIKTDKLDNLYKISIIHNFDYYNLSLDSNLILAGHNLNGELYIPYFGGILGNNKYNKRNYTINNMPVYISNGLGSPHKLRMFNHPSINVYRLMNH